jgi:hypothetical protein
VPKVPDKSELLQFKVVSFEDALPDLSNKVCGGIFTPAANICQEAVVATFFGGWASSEFPQRQSYSSYFPTIKSAW